MTYTAHPKHKPDSHIPYSTDQQYLSLEYTYLFSSIYATIPQSLLFLLYPLDVSKPSFSIPISLSRIDVSLPLFSSPLSDAPLRALTLDCFREVGSNAQHDCVEESDSQYKQSVTYTGMWSSDRNLLTVSRSNLSVSPGVIKRFVHSFLTIEVTDELKDDGHPSNDLMLDTIDVVSEKKDDGHPSNDLMNGLKRLLNGTIDVGSRTVCQMYGALRSAMQSIRYFLLSIRLTERSATTARQRLMASMSQKNIQFAI